MEIDIKEIVSAYGLELKNFEKYKSVYKCETNDGIKNLKENGIYKETVDITKDEELGIDFTSENIYKLGHCLYDYSFSPKRLEDILTEIENETNQDKKVLLEKDFEIKGHLEKCRT